MVYKYPLNETTDNKQYYETYNISSGSGRSKEIIKTIYAIELKNLKLWLELKQIGGGQEISNNKNPAQNLNQEDKNPWEVTTKINFPLNEEYHNAGKK